MGLASKRSVGRERRRSALGYERARQHIDAAERLSRELGGVDESVKAYLFGLPSVALQGILSEYGRQYGPAARRYAEETIAKWRTGTVRMSGLVAERLFALLPPMMTLETKYKLVEELWRRTGPSTSRTLRVGVGATVEEIAAAASRHVEEAVGASRIPEGLQKRFAWLAAGDVRVKELLLNHLLELEKVQAVDWIRMQAPILLAHLQSGDGALTTRFVQIANVGKHKLEIVVDRNASGVRLDEAVGCARDYGARWARAILAGVALLAGTSRIDETIISPSAPISATADGPRARAPEQAPVSPFDGGSAARLQGPSRKAPSQRGWEAFARDLR